MKVGQCILIKPKGKWLCVKYHHHDADTLYYVQMHLDMLHKTHVKKMKFDRDRIRSIYQGKNENPLKGGEPIEFN